MRLDYISCCLTILSTVLIGRRQSQGWIVAGVNSAILCIIGFDTRQTGLIPANLFCLALYAYNLRKWRSPAGPPKSQTFDDTGLARTPARRRFCTSGMPGRTAS